VAGRILVVDDHASMAETIADGLGALGYEAIALASGPDAARALEAERFDALVTDLRMPGVDGLQLLAVSRKLDPNRPVIVMTAFSAVDSAIESIRQGAYHYLTKPFKVAELALFLAKALDEARVRREAATLRRALRDRFGLENLVGNSAAMKDVCDLVERVADTNAPVLVLGETGTGKGLVARALHACGARSSGPFVAVNCASLPDNLLESELFGHVKGAFTGATATRSGLLEEANGGTLFLDEIGEMAPALQAKMLHVLESGTVRAVGSDQERRVDVRVVAATHRNLRQRVAEGAFREDLLYRLDVVTIELPALRHRREDLPLLVEHFLGKAKEKHARSPAVRLAPDALAKVMAHSWPGNVRELEHVIERAVILARDAAITAADLPSSVGEPSTAQPDFGGEVVPMREMQRRYAHWAYERLGGRKVLTADTLGLDFKTLSKLLGSDGDK
jgi:two-component system response regulator HydG